MSGDYYNAKLSGGSLQRVSRFLQHPSGVNRHILAGVQITIGSNVLQPAIHISEHLMVRSKSLYSIILYTVIRCLMLNHELLLPAALPARRGIQLLQMHDQNKKIWQKAEQEGHSRQASWIVHQFPVIRFKWFRSNRLSHCFNF